MTIKAKYKCLKVLMVCLTTICIFTSLAHTQSEKVTLVGEINDTHQLVTDGEIYDIADTPAGDTLAQDYISMKVKVIGTIEPGDELRIVRVISFETVDE